MRCLPDSNVLVSNGFSDSLCNVPSASSPITPCENPGFAITNTLGVCNPKTTVYAIGDRLNQNFAKNGTDCVQNQTVKTTEGMSFFATAGVLPAASFVAMASTPDQGTGRLRPRRFAGGMLDLGPRATSFDVGVTLFDTKRNETCVVIQTSADTAQCLPFPQDISTAAVTVASGTSVFADAACTVPAGARADAPGCDAPTYSYAVPTCGDVGDPIPLTEFAVVRRTVRWRSHWIGFVDRCVRATPLSCSNWLKSRWTDLAAALHTV
jgi:hypothetical protein